MAKLVAFTRRNGEAEYTEFSWFENELTEAELINEVYFGYDSITDEENGLAHHKDTISSNRDNVYWFGDELVYVKFVTDISDEELEVLKKFYIV